MGSDRRTPRSATPDGDRLPGAAGRQLVYLAAERTLLAWVRAAIGLVVVGFAVDRFGILLASRRPEAFLGTAASTWAGLALIGTGVLISAVSAFHYVRFLRGLERGEAVPTGGLLLAIGLAVLLALLGIVLAGYLWLASTRLAFGHDGLPDSPANRVAAAEHRTEGRVGEQGPERGGPTVVQREEPGWLELSRGRGTVVAGGHPGMQRG
jgi:putative membrane protein